MQNRVTGNNISTINGRLTATGSVFLINRNGVIIGKNGVIETGGSISAPNGTAALITEREDWGCQFFNHRTGHDCCSQGGIADQWGNIYVLAGNKGGSNNAIGVTKSGGHIFLTAPGGRVIVRKQVRARRRIFRNSRPRIDGGDIFVNANIVNI